jgi:NAD(P)-dependent dehydrogenase (short-subunit alcohol dehydrogenase family)
MTLSGEIAVITGAGRGIGESVAHAFARSGANLVLVARTSDEIERVARETAERGITSIALVADVSKRDDVERVAAAAFEKFGRVDILVNAAGIYGPIGPFVENDLDHWAAAIETNLMGTVFSIRAVLPRMLERRKGVIVNFSGGGAVQPLPRFSAYGASKAAVVRLTETLAEEVGESGVRVNAIAPGAVNSRLLDQVLAAGERAGVSFYAKALEQKAQGGTPPERAAELAVFLASAEGKEVSGRLISAVWDDWKSLPGRAGELRSSALFTLRRIDGRQFREVGASAAR